MDDERAFDAAESYLCETDREPSAQWRTVSLVTGILGLISRGPEFEQTTPEARRDAIRSAVSELSGRGLDGLALIRYGMQQEVAAPIISALLVKLIFNDDSVVAEGLDTEGWYASLDLDSALPCSEQPTIQEIANRFEEVILPIIPRIGWWVASASLEELINLTPPLPGGSADSPVRGTNERKLREQYRWAVDHFAKTFYRDWETSSLHYELRWLDGDILPPCPDGIMRDRSVRRQDIIEEIAQRAVYRTGAPGVGDSVAAEMTRHARTLLRHDKYREAAAVFEFGIVQRPDDPEIRNNLGFCLIPVDPRVALEHLKTAANMGYRPTVTNSYNQMCCYAELGRSRAALNLADAEWNRLNSQVQPALLWSPTGSGGWRLIDCSDPAQAIASLATEIAHREGWREQEELWQAKKNGRTSVSDSV